MKVSEQLLKHIASLSNPHAEAIHKTVASAFPCADPRPMHALVLAYQLGTILHELDRYGEDNAVNDGTINAILANAGGYMLIDTETDDDKLAKRMAGITENE
jgi:hypothetical protein